LWGKVAESYVGYGVVRKNAIVVWGERLV